MSKTLLYTIHGSHLYGMNHAESDIDYYMVVSEENRKVKAKQTIIDGIDTTVVGYSGFMEMCFKGVPQALEAMFSTQATIDELKAFRSSYKAGGAGVVDVYRRTIYNFSHEKRSGEKYKKHAVRLTLNLNSLLQYEKFNPTLTSDEIAIVNRLHLLPEKIFESELNAISLVQIFN